MHGRQARAFNLYVPLLHRLSSQPEATGPVAADFYCSRHRLVIELDGDSHYRDKALVYDEARTLALNARGIRVIRFTNTDVMQNFEAVCSEILRALDPTIPEQE